MRNKDLSPELWRIMLALNEEEKTVENKKDDFGGLGMMIGFIFAATLLSRLIAKITEVL